MKRMFRMVMTALLLTMLASCGSTGTTTNTASTATTGGMMATATTGGMMETATAGGMMMETAISGSVMLPAVDAATVKGNIITAGSSTVFPLTQRMAERFEGEGYTGDITVDSIGSGAGIERFCVAAETDIANSSRAIKKEEIEQCKAKGREVVEFRVGTDALSIVVSTKNTFATKLTLAQLASIYSGEYKTWNQVDPSFPSEAIRLYSPGTDSGTYDYFVEVVLDKKPELLQAANPQQSEDDNVLVQGVESSPYAIGYFGYAYYNENKNRLKALSLDGVSPTEETAENGEYPLSRPLYIYSARNILTEKPQVAAFVNFYLTNVNNEIVDVGYFPASAAALNQARQSLLDASK